jgi:hypothetical protein
MSILRLPLLLLSLLQLLYTTEVLLYVVQVVNAGRQITRNRHHLHKKNETEKNRQ